MPDDAIGDGMSVTSGSHPMRPSGSDSSPAGDDLGVRLDRTSAVPLYRQVETAIRGRITSGTLPVGTRLPPERKLATALGVDRTTVVAAYRELAADGLVSAHVGRGTTVSEPPARPRGGDLEPSRGVVWDHVLTLRDEEDPILSRVSALTAREGVISFAGGTPARETYPIEAFRRLVGEALDSDSTGAGLLEYSPPEGLPGLRDVLAARMDRRGVPVGRRNLIVCAGSQQGLYLLARALVDPGDVVAVEAPSYLGALQVFRAVGARVVAIPADRDGLDVGRLEDHQSRRSVKLIYVLPTFQNPTGATMSLARRERLLAVARRHGVAIIEDDPYGDLRYGGDVVPSLLALDHGRGSPVIYLSTFSKVLFPGFRLGWVAAPEAVVERLAWVKALVDLDTNPLAQWAVAEFVRRGDLDAHVASLTGHYRARRDALLGHLGEIAGDRLSVRAPEGGFYLWVRLRGGVNARAVLAEAEAEDVAFVPGEVFFAAGGGRESLRLAFSAVPPERMAEGVRRLVAAIDRAAERGVSQRRAAPAGRIV